MKNVEYIYKESYETSLKDKATETNGNMPLILVSKIIKISVLYLIWILLWSL